MKPGEPMQPSRAVPLRCFTPRAGLARRCGGTILLLAAAMLPAACINVTAPEEPIVIELNINIRQEVIYRLAADAGNTIEENEEIF